MLMQARLSTWSTTRMMTPWSQEKMQRVHTTAGSYHNGGRNGPRLYKLGSRAMQRSAPGW